MTATEFARNASYGLVVGGYFVGAALDARARCWKSAVIALLFGIAGAVIFFWRT